MSGSPISHCIKMIVGTSLLLALLSGCGVDRSKQVESHDFSPDEFNRLVYTLLKRFGVPVVKNIGFVELPSMGLTNSKTDWLGEHNLLSFDSFAACGALCNDLQRNGYATEFVSAFAATEQGQKAKAAMASHYYGESTSLEIDFAAMERNQISFNYQSCIIMPFNQVFRVYMCAKAGNFQYAYAIKNGFLKEKHELDYANVAGDARFTVEGHVAWYDLYDWIEANE